MKRDNWTLLWNIKFDGWLKENRSVLQEGEEEFERKNFSNWLKSCKSASLNDLKKAITSLEEKIAQACTTGDTAYIRCRLNFLQAAREHLSYRQNLVLSPNNSN